VKTGEQFECRDCFHIGSLTVRGECEECGSQAVVSQELLTLLEYRQALAASA
jgi:hypothetical protein